MDFKTFYTTKPVNERESFAQQAGTTRGYCNQIAFADKKVELGMADVFVALSDGALTLDGVPLTDRAKAQRAIREAGASVRPAISLAAVSPA